MSVLTCFRGAAPAMPALPPPAPLPSLTVAFSRRAAIFDAAVSTGALAGSAARALGPVTDDMPRLYAEAHALRAAADRAVSDAEVEALADRLTDLERRAATVRVTTPAGAVAALEWVLADLVREDGTAAVSGFHPALIGQALAMLRRIGRAL